MLNEKLTTYEYWENSRSNVVYKRHDKGHEIDKFLLKYIPPAVTNASMIEIGSFPGPHLATFGDLGYQLNGVDFCLDNEKGLPDWLKKEGYTVGEFSVSDFFKFQPGRQYNVVCSFGFIEHFTNYEEVIAKHASLVNDKGYLVITTPNFRGFIQNQLHKHFDKNNLAIHNIDSMQPEKWAKQLTALGFDVIYKGHFGGFWFWRDNEKLSPLKTKLIWVIERSIHRIRKFLKFESPAYSAYCGIVSKRK